MLGLQGSINICFVLVIAVTISFYLSLKEQCQMRQDTIYQKSIDGTLVQDTVENEGSSVLCWGSDHTNRICRFRNLCYHTKWQEFLFFHGRNSLYNGLPENRFSPTLLELSSVRNHNGHFFNFVDISASKGKLLLSHVQMIKGTSLLFNRFHPQNLMHVFHDDLLPLYYTMESLLLVSRVIGSEETGNTQVQLVTMDFNNEGEYWELYKLITNQTPLSRKQLEASGGIMCFQDAIVGLNKTTTWYQYGFFEPQGPIDGYNVTATELNKFTDLIRNRLNITVSDITVGPIVLLTRKATRLIVNEMELTLSLAKEMNRKVVLVGAETHSVRDMIDVISQASVLIGMHGSLFIFSLFLPPHAAIIELFPYAVAPENYTPYKTLASILGLGYRSWRNIDLTKTISYPNRQPELGGINHLSEQEQERIQTSTEVPLHLCCSNPDWLFRIYQDTEVDIPASIVQMKSAMEEPKRVNSLRPMGPSHKLYPSFVRNIHCASGVSLPSIFLSWEIPQNLYLIDYKTVKYEVWVQEAGQANYTAWIFSKTNYTLNKYLKSNTVYNVWVRCIIDDTVIGPFNIEQIECISP